MNTKESEESTGKRSHRRQRTLKPTYGRFWPKMTRDSIIADVERRVAQRDEAVAPEHVVNLDVDEPAAATVVNGRNYNRLSVEFSIPPDSNIDHVRVLLKGYGTGDELGVNGKRAAEWLPWREVTRVEKSPVDIDLELSGEHIMVGALAVNDKGITADITTIPTVSITLL